MNLTVLRNKVSRWHAALPLHWFLAALVAINGTLLLGPGVAAVRAMHPYSWLDWFSPDAIAAFLDSFGLFAATRLLLGAGLIIMAIGLLFRARIAWAVALLLLICSGLFYSFSRNTYLGLGAYSLMLVAALALYWRRFDRSSLAAGSLFAGLGVTSLLVYAVLGTLYLGEEFSPPIKDAATAFYFSIVSMSTVGYGDITPQTVPARLFTSSIIILGITIFATSISAIAGPIIGGRIQRLVHGKLRTPMRKDHIIIAGATPLAHNVYRFLHEQGHNVTVIVPPEAPHDYPGDADVIVGDSTDGDILISAGVANALYVLALRSDDSENAFIVLAAKERGGAQTRTVALANTSTHLNKIRQVNPDVVFSLQTLGAEILSRMIMGQPIDNDLITNLLFPGGTKPPAVAAK